MNWIPASQAEEGIVYLTKIEDERGARNVQELVRKGRLWFTPDMKTYVYYTPTHFARLRN